LRGFPEFEFVDKSLKLLAIPAGFEPATHGVEIRYSISGGAPRENLRKLPGKPAGIRVAIASSARSRSNSDMAVAQVLLSASSRDA
jgi:hypothetical protein